MNNMGKEQGSPKETQPKTVPELLRNHTMRATKSLRITLKQESEDMPDDDLGESSRKRADMYIAELDILDSQLQQLAGESNPLHPVVRQHRQQMGRQGYENLFTVRWAPRGETLPFGPENPQNQLTINAVVSAPEDISEAIYGESVKGKAPAITLQNLLERATRQVITHYKYSHCI